MKTIHMPVKANDVGELVDARDNVVADFWTADFAREQAIANAEAAAQLMNKEWEMAA